MPLILNQMLLPLLTVEYTLCPQKNERSRRNSLQQILGSNESTTLNPHILVDSSSSKRKMGNYDQFKTIKTWTNGQSQINILFHSSPTWYTISPDKNGSQNLMSDGDTTTYESKKETSGKQLSKQATDYSNLRLCFSVLQTPQQHFRPWWMMNSKKK